MSKTKIKPLLDEYCTQNDIICISESLIGKIINRNNMFYFKTGRVYHNPSHKHSNLKNTEFKKRLDKRFKPSLCGSLFR